jgi:hypothetical protein
MCLGLAHMDSPQQVRCTGRRSVAWFGAIVVAAPIAVLLAAAAPARAADQSSPPDADETGESSTRVYLTLGPGLSTVGVTGLASLTVEASSYQLSARGSGAVEIALGVSPGEKIEERALLVGKVWRRRPLSVHVALGMAATDTVRRGAYLHDSDGMYGGEVYEERRGHSLGIPLEIGVSWDSCCVGGGVALVGNLNPDLTLIGIVGTFRLGKLR